MGHPDCSSHHLLTTRIVLLTIFRCGREVDLVVRAGGPGKESGAPFKRSLSGSFCLWGRDLDSPRENPHSTTKEVVEWGTRIVPLTIFLCGREVDLVDRAGGPSKEPGAPFKRSLSGSFCLWG
jgi:hypothetical protein